MDDPVFTIGHSTHSSEYFIGLLRKHGVTALCDVRSHPYSKISPQFNRETIRETLRQHGIVYVFLGGELGARSTNPSCYVSGKVQYERLSETDIFRRGLTRVSEGIKKYQLALMCAEKDPLDCHRSILIARRLERDGMTIQHILGNGALEAHEDAMKRLIHLLRMPERDMFRSWDDIVNDAYRVQGERIAYTKDDPSQMNGKPFRSAAS
jgi:uncharacterized protein (DUF488 family)